MVDVQSNDLDRFFHETQSLFKDVKSYAILLEKLGGGKVEITSINELRSVLFHLYELGEQPEGKANHHLENYIEAKEHLYRAYYDLFALLCSFLIDNINNYSSVFDLEVIHKAYPSYFSNILPETTVIVERISKLRSVRQTNGKMSEGSNLEDNTGIITVLLQWYKELQSRTNIFIQFQEKANAEVRKAKNKDRLDLILKIVIPLVTLGIGFVLSYFWGKK